MNKLEGIDPIKRETVAGQVARRLAEYLLSGEIEPGTRMPSERQLAESFGVGRSAMREALKSLALIGLVEVRQGDGTYFRKAESDLLPDVIEWGLLLGERKTMDLVEARQEIEVVLAGMAARRRSEADVEELRAHLNGMRDARDVSAFVDADVAFHLKVAESAGNSALREIHSSIQALLRAWIRRVLSSTKSNSPSYEEHVSIFEAIEAQDDLGAQQAMRSHMESAADRLRHTLASEQAAEAARS